MPSPRSRGGKTAIEVIREREERLRTDPEYRAQHEAVEVERAERTKRLRATEGPLLADLAELGLRLETVWNLRSRQPYPDGTVEVLLHHLAEPLPDRVREGIARALAHVNVRWAWPNLVQAYRNEQSLEDSGARQGLAEALMVTAHRGVADDLVALIRDRTLGSSRVLLLRAITRLRLPGGWELIGECVEDPDLEKEAEHVLAQRARRQERKG